MKVSASIRKEKSKLTLLPTIQYYYAFRMMVFVWLDYEFQVQIK